ncbi:FERM, ARHGEF and pleckstrin domain-containing protein 1 [Galemys pyrenaicus]|uniref:FERM, ARHGEF and pleckstrin domain-containing protein 1 n=1 Tax=Galemys pyrenaicus TaxID=202257 RepID=A0A8J6DYG1_GALPY|nr:FERM, ARHGEF and pleckstrin domain-containing protein 1 [Galemys pyrenaicus]
MRMPELRAPTARTVRMDQENRQQQQQREKQQPRGEGRSNAQLKEHQRIGDVMLKNIQGMKGLIFFTEWLRAGVIRHVTPHLLKTCLSSSVVTSPVSPQQLLAHLWKHSEALEVLEASIRGSRRLENVCRDFELQKVCYLPLNTFLLRPLHRLMHYKQVLERLCKHQVPSQADFRDCRAALAEITEMAAQLHGTMIKMENFQKLHELKKDLIGIDNLVIPGRVSSPASVCTDGKPGRSLSAGAHPGLSLQEFIRLGSLSKLSGKGLQQRMFFLFNDMLLYTSRGLTASNQFKVHGQLPLYGMTIEKTEDEWGVPHCLTLRGQRQSIIVAASSRSEMEKWVEDIEMAIDLAEKSSGPTPEFLAGSPPDSKSPEEAGAADQESEDDLSASRTSLERQAPHRGNTMVHVCWHRNTSVSMVDFSVAVEVGGGTPGPGMSGRGWGSTPPGPAEGSPRRYARCTPEQRPAPQPPDLGEEGCGASEATRSVDQAHPSPRDPLSRGLRIRSAWGWDLRGRCSAREQALTHGPPTAPVPRLFPEAAPPPAPCPFVCPTGLSLLQNQLSGNLLRKFKNSNGWQKLWVVFTNFCLFFYKSHQDSHPLASLPLLGYSLTIPSESEEIHKDYVFKLHFKSHVYYFRAESEYTFESTAERLHRKAQLDVMAGGEDPLKPGPTSAPGTKAADDASDRLEEPLPDLCQPATASRLGRSGSVASFSPAPSGCRDNLPCVGRRPTP